MRSRRQPTTCLALATLLFCLQEDHVVIENNALDGEQRVDAAVADHIADGHIRAEVGVLPYCTL